MYFFGFVVWLISLPPLATSYISSQIYDIDLAKDSQDVTLVLLNTGQVTKIAAGKSEILDQLLQNKSKDQSYIFTIDDERFIIEAKPVKSTPLAKDFPSSFFEEKAPYVRIDVAS